MSKMLEVRAWSMNVPVDVAKCTCGEEEEPPEIYATTHWELDGIDGYRVGCPACGDMTFEYKTRMDAIKSWNELKGDNT